MKYQVRTGTSFILANKQVVTEGIISDDDKLVAGVNRENIEAQLWKLEEITEPDANAGQKTDDTQKDAVPPVPPAETSTPAADLPKVLSDIQPPADAVKPKSKSKEKQKNESTGASGSDEPDANAANGNS